MPNKPLNRDERKQKTKKQLLDKATEMFAEQGFHNTSLNKIATSLGYTKGAIYTHFKSKQELFLAVFQQQQKDDIETISEFVNQYPLILDFIYAMESHHKFERENNQVWSILRLEFLLQALREDELRIKLSKIVEQSRIQIANLLEHYAKTGQLSNLEVSLSELAFLIVSLDIGLGIQYYIDTESLSDDIYAKGLKGLLNY